MNQLSTSPRRQFIKQALLAGGSLAVTSALPFDVFANTEKKKFFEISLAQWSLHKTLFSGALKNIEFPAKAKNDFGIDIVEYVSPFFDGKHTDMGYLKELKQRTDDLAVRNHLIMIDREGNLGDSSVSARQKAVDNHKKWIDAAKVLGCKTIRVNAGGNGTPDQVKAAVVDGLGKLAAYGRSVKINVIVENHGGISSDGQWLSSVMSQVNSPYCGTLPDFGNFRISGTKEYDRYKGVRELLPFAKGVSAKSFDFDENGNETTIDYLRMFDIIKEAGWKGIVGIEYEGSRLKEEEGIKKTKLLLERIQAKYS